MRARDIKPGFFLNEYLAACSPHARLLFIGLWMLADREGRLEDRPKQIEASIFPYEKVNIEKLLKELENVPGDHPFIRRYEVNRKRYIQVVNFKKHQNPHRNEKESSIPAPQEEEEEAREITGVTPEMDRATREMERATPEISRATPADSLTPDSLTPDILTPDSLIADSLKEASPNGEAQRSLRAPPPLEEEKRTQETAQLEEALKEVPPPEGVSPPQSAGATERTGFPSSAKSERTRKTAPQPLKMERSLRSPPHPGKARRSMHSPPHPAVEAYKKAFFYYPRRNLYSLIAEKVGDDEEDLRLWAKACQSWAAHGWNPRNIAGLLEYYEKRGFLEKVTISRGIPRFSKAAQVAIELAEKYEREEGNEEDHGEKEDSNQGISAFFKTFAPSPFPHPP